MNEATFLQNISQRLGRTQAVAQEDIPQRDVVGVPEFWRSHQLAEEDSITQFRQVLNQLGGASYICSSPEAVRERLQALFTALSPQRIATWQHDEYSEFGLNASDMEELLAPYTVLEWGRCDVTDIADADIGITGCAGGIADTGTLMLAATPGRGRSVSVLPSVHIAILPISKLKTRMGELFATALFDTQGVPSQVHFISGPSRSSDIENDQSIGVHGPAAVHVLLYDDTMHADNSPQGKV